MPKPLRRWRSMRLLSEGYTAIYNGIECGFTSYDFIVTKFNEPGRKMSCHHLSYITDIENQIFICSTIHLFTKNQYNRICNYIHILSNI